jgi:hypothetical protein
MKSSFLILLIAFSTSCLYAQDEEAQDTTLIISPPGETESDSEESFGQDDEDSYDQPEHTLVDPDEVVRKTDYSDEEIKIKKFDSKKWKKVVGSTDYQEEPEEEEQEKEQTENSGINIPWANPVLQLVGYAIIIAIVLTILYYVAQHIKIDSRLDKRPLTADDPMKNVEHIDELDVNQLLQKSIAEGNFKLAVRLYFLRLLKGLHTGGVIAWKKDKTNRDYLSEIFARNFYFNEVRQLTLAYELLWYGDHTVTNEIYKELFREFDAIQQKLINSKQS